MVDLRTLNARAAESGSLGTVVSLPKKPGRPKGTGKWPGSGRKKGGANRSTQELRALIHRKGRPVEVLCAVAAGTETIEGLSRADALRLLFKTVVPELKAEIVSGPDDGPVKIHNVMETAGRVAEALSKAAGAADPGSALDDDGLRGIQAVSYLWAQHELAAGGATFDAERRNGSGSSADASRGNGAVRANSGGDPPGPPAARSDAGPMRPTPTILKSKTPAPEKFEPGAEVEIDSALNLFARLLSIDPRLPFGGEHWVLLRRQSPRDQPIHHFKTADLETVKIWVGVQKRERRL